jgi:hypothetical protein
MKNIINTALSFIAFVLLLNISVFAQFNPVNGLEYEQSYDYGNSFCPSYNCFYLSWGVPDISSETLVGYNVYRNDELYLFTESTHISCDGMGPCSSDDFYDSSFPFWVKVKAVYNEEKIESIANDSIYVCDLYLYIDKIESFEIELLQNPISEGENIRLYCNNPMNLYKIKVISLNGKLIKEVDLFNKVGNYLNITSEGMSGGFYIINIQTEDKIISKKLLIR